MDRGISKDYKSPMIDPMLPQWKGLLSRGLEEDGWQWDWTSLGALSRRPESLPARVVGQGAGRWAGNGLLAAVSALSAELGGKIEITTPVADGAAVKKG